MTLQESRNPDLSIAFVKYVEYVGRMNDTDIITEALYSLGQKRSLVSDADTFYKGLVPTTQRESDVVMIEAIIMWLEKLRDKFYG